MTDTLPLSIQPVISYPKEAEVGKTYLMEIDLQMPESGFEWQYEEEEYLIYCMVNAGNLFTVTSVGEPAIVLHRFGGTYGNAKFLLEAAQEENEGEIKITLVNSWGVPIKQINLAEIQVIEQLANLPVLTPVEIVRQQNLSCSDIDSLVQEVKQKIASDITVRCGTMRVLDMMQPVDLDRIYTDVNIIKDVTERRRISYDEGMEVTTREHFDRFLAGATQERVTGIEAVEEFQKLMVLGKPGAGKTTFMKYLAMSCLRGRFHVELVPIFVTLKTYTEKRGQPSLENYILTKFQKFKVSADTMKRLLKEGGALILLDGLDEVKKKDDHRVKYEIDQFTKNWQKNRFVITCRIAAREYLFEDFTEVEVADFGDHQIEASVNNWFGEEDESKAELMLEKLKNDKSLIELAKNPLLLMLLCLVFAERNNFPPKRSELYKEGLEVLMKKWDAKRNIEREIIYKHLSPQNKEDMLGQIAFNTFVNNEYFFQKENLQRQIKDYICNLPEASANPAALRLDSEAVLKAIEHHHGLLVERARGIYSFSHLTIHEYLAARQIAYSQFNENQQLLVDHITDKRWREVILLATEMMTRADNLVLLMKENIDILVLSDNKIQEFVNWIYQKSSLVLTSSYKISSLRAFYFNLVVYLSFPNPKLDTSFNFSIVSNSNPDLDLDYSLCNLLSQALYGGYSISRLRVRIFEPDYTITDENLNRELNKLREDFFIIRKLMDNNQQWEERIKSWTEQLRNVMIQYRNIGYDWQFTEAQTSILENYYYANSLLEDCLSHGYVSHQVVKEIESATLRGIPEKILTDSAKTENSELPDINISGIMEIITLNEDFSESPAKTQIVKNLIVSGSLSEISLRDLMNDQFQELSHWDNLQYHNEPTHIFIYAYITIEHAEAGMGQWIAMLSKIGEGQEPSIQVNERQLAYINTEPEERFGLLEEQRKKIFQELFLAERKASREAEEEYPIDPSQSLKVEHSFILTKDTPLMPALNLESLLPTQSIQQLSAGIIITVNQIEQKGQTPWYFVNAMNPNRELIGSGWINSIALMGQSKINVVEQLQRKSELQEQLKNQYASELATKHELSNEQLQEINLEGIQKDWALLTS